MPRDEDHWKKWPAHLHLPRQIYSVHDTRKPNIGEDYRDLSAADDHGCKRCFRAFAFYNVPRSVFEQCRHQTAEFSVVLDDQYGSTLPPHRDPPPSFRCDRHPIGAQAPPDVPEEGKKPRQRMSSVSLQL